MRSSRSWSTPPTSGSSSARAFASGASSTTTRRPSDLALRAARQALERAGVGPEEIDLIVVGTTAGDMLFPTTGNLLQHRLGCRNAGSMDVYAACSGSVYSLSVGAQYIQTGKYETVLCVGAECLSRITDYTDRGTCILLADAAGAVVLRAADGDAGIIDTDLYSDGRYGDLLMQPAGGSRHPATHETVDKRMHFAKMKGNEVFKVAVRMFGDCAQRILERNGFKPTDLDLFVPHQANLRIIEAAVKRLGAADGPRDRQRRPLRQHGRRVRVRGARGGVGDQAPARR